MSNIVPLSTQFDAQQIEIMRQTVAKDVPPPEFAVFLQVCQARQLNPFNREIYAIMRGSANNRQMTIQVSIDGFRLLAERSGRYRGQIGPLFCGSDGMWKEEWLQDSPPVAAKVGIIRSDFDAPIWAIARYKSYVQMKDGGPTEMWRKMPDVLLAKCAEALAIRKTFPLQVAGLYVHEEMMQADTVPVGKAKMVAPSLKALCIAGQDAHLWESADGFYEFCSDFLERQITRDNGKSVTPEERNRLGAGIETLIQSGFSDKTTVVESVASEEQSSDGFVSIDDLSKELVEQQAS